MGLAKSRLCLLIAIVGVLLIAAFVAAIVLSRSQGTTYARNSPDAAVQHYLTLLQDGRVDAAYGMNDSDLGLQEFHDSLDNWGRQSHSITLVRSSVHSEQATVTVDISAFTGGPFGPTNTTTRTTFTLTRHGKGWRISGPDYLPYE